MANAVDDNNGVLVGKSLSYKFTSSGVSVPVRLADQLQLKKAPVLGLAAKGGVCYCF